MNLRGAKLLTVVLAATCGILLLAVLALQFGFGRGFRWLPLDATAAAMGADKVDRNPFTLPPEAQFAATMQRPLFNEDRKPTPDEPDEPETPPPPKVALTVELTGVILTPQLHLAMIRDKTKNDTIALKEGMPMPGDEGGWVLTEIKPRSVIFREVSGDEVEVELTTAVASPKANQHARSGTTGGAARGAGPHVPPANRQAEQLQRRIEERRKQMREQAERMRRQQHPEKQQ
ncbi:MAG TPA: hypothetical protein VFN13_00995 [Rudaea sp.]|nr:hypothetical protein [Rudaea sp.]